MNNNLHEIWLQEKQAESKQKQAKFMMNIAQRLGHERLSTPPSRSFVGAPSFWNEKNWDKETCIETFKQHFISVGGHVQIVKTKEAAAQFIIHKIDELSAKQVMLQNVNSLRDLALEQHVTDHVELQYWNSHANKNWKHVAAEADIGIVEAEYAIAYTGSVVVTSSEQKGRSVSLLPTVLIILIPASTFVTRLGEALTKIGETNREDLPAGIHFISGPSRSSDIENDLTIGVHGPGIVFAVIVEDL